MAVLTTYRLTLRPWQITDLDDLYAYSQSPLVGPMAGWKMHETRAEAAAALQTYITQKYHFAVVLKEENRVIGAVKLNPDNNRGKYSVLCIVAVILGTGLHDRSYTGSDPVCV